MKTELPFSLVRKIDSALIQLDKIPLSGNAPHFDIEQISSLVASHLGSPSLKIEIEDCSWREPAKIKESLGSSVLSLGIAFTPLAGLAIWLMGREDLAHLTSYLMNGEKHAITINSEILQEGFYRYLALQTLDALQGLEPFKDFTLKLSEENDFTTEDAYCIDIKISFDRCSCWGRLVLSGQFLTSWQRHFSSLRELFSLSPIAKNIEVPLSLSAGFVHLTAKEWKSIKEGDFVLLERGGYDPRHQEGMATLMLNTTPLMHVDIKENKLKLLDYVRAYEENMKESEETPNMKENEETPPEEQRSMAIKELPLTVIVELARLNMTVDQLMKLSPGNFLEIPIHPEQEVALTVNGQKVGRGELVYLGEALGVRVLETAD